MLLIFSDLDGTLLDHQDYRWDDAKPALAALRERGIPLILASSKTAAEIAPLRAALGFADCEAIVENGAGLLEPGRDGIAESARNRDLLLATLRRVPADLRAGFSGFADWSLERTIALTGLDREAAELARQRDFSEPGLWQGEEERRQDFIEALSALGIHAARGGRFLTLSLARDKSQRMAEIIARHPAPDGGRPRTVALGDAPNDLEMLRQADCGILIPNPALDQEKLPLRGLRRATRPGPAGWNDAVLELLAETDH